MTPFDALGGAPGVRALVRRFYFRMDELPEFNRLRNMHPTDLSGSEDKLYSFLSGWLGGPPLFHEKYGPPMMRRRHLPFVIGEEERDQWVRCMKLAMSDLEIEKELSSRLLHAFFQMADHFRNDAQEER